jgi:D-glycero-D-manno-heptose 1,7-bisphosphate phosphatase
VDAMSMPPDHGSTARRAVFLDRDGTINVDRGYVYNREQFEWIPGAIEAIRRLKEAGALVVVVTNQGGIGHGLYTEADVRILHRFMSAELLRAGTGIDAYYYCPFHPDAIVETYRTNDDCRKPKPGMIRRAASELMIDVASSWLVGDKVSDIEAGRRAGARTVLVRTGYGADAEPFAHADLVADDLPGAVELILNDGWTTTP